MEWFVCFCFVSCLTKTALKKRFLAVNFIIANLCFSCNKLGFAEMSEQAQ